MQPEAVKRAAEEADRKIRALAEASTAEPETANQDPSEKPTQRTDSSKEPPAPRATDSQNADDESVADLRKELDAANQRWKTLNGMIRAQNQEMQKYKDRVEELESQLTSAQPAPQASESQPPAQKWSEQDEDAFGSDLVRYIHSTAQAMVSDALAPLKSELETIKPALDKTSQLSSLTARDRFESKLDALAPNWRALDADQGFIDWLQERPAIGRSFAAGVSELDHSSVADVFNLYEELSSPDPDPKAQKRQKELEQQAAPPKNRQPSSAESSADTENKWTLSEIQEVYRTRRGKDGRQLTPQEFDAIEREIAAAQAQGRVDYSR